ncbi:hypothetical protein HGM15179_012953 [Zosterops borbonicus]|uniref:EF-hand domain-containing protein n=1 Tax=Zosterops borbonicus TaxID=364589 RepID=A0A8K1LHL8_9PASS|nr:hypothetical protein HGM15179_012953 [Zosterops borbonicus]
MILEKTNPTKSNFFSPSSSSLSKLYESGNTWKMGSKEEEEFSATGIQDPVLDREMRQATLWKCAHTVVATDVSEMERKNDLGSVRGMFLVVDADEIKRLGKRFKKLDLDNSGSLSVEEFMSLPELQQNPLVQRVIDIFDTDGNGEVDFKEFIEGVSQFSVKGDKEQKLRFAFRIYDMDKDGYISNGELFQVLKMMVGNNLKDTQLQQIVDKTIINADKDGDGRISFEEFCAVVGGLDIHKKMVVDV